MFLRLILFSFMFMQSQSSSQASHTVASASRQARSAEVSRLNAEKSTLDADIKILRSSEDFWNGWNRWLGFATVGVGGLLGLGAFFAQRSAVNASVTARPKIERQQAIDDELRVLYAQESDEKIQDAKAAAATAQKDAGTANSRAQQASLEQAQLSRSNLQLEATVEQERMARLKLEDRLRPRTISVGKAAILKDLLGKRKPHGVTVICIMNNPESCQYAKELAIALKDGGWYVDPNSIDGAAYVKPPVGVLIMAASASNQSAAYLQYALDASGIQTKGNLDPKLTQTEIKLIVGVKEP